MRFSGRVRGFLLVALVAVVGCSGITPANDGEKQSAVSLGSGHAYLKNKIINYEYYKFGGFQMRLGEESLTWEGYRGFFTGPVSKTYPQMSKVSDDIYFVSWETVPNRGDNVVWNFDAMKVNAHLGGGDAFRFIYGVIHCWDQPECVGPPDEDWARADIKARVDANLAAKGFKTMNDALGPVGTMNPADLEGMALLEGKSLVYSTPDGDLRIDFQGKELVAYDPVTGNKQHKTHATRIADGVYFVSWGGDFGGNHVVFNAGSMKVYDHIRPDGTRKEAIYEATCFADTNRC